MHIFSSLLAGFCPSKCHSDDLLNINTSYYEGMVTQIYPAELQLNKANSTDTESPKFFIFAFISF